MTKVLGRHALVELLATAGVRYVFGNPGTTELPFMDALAEQERICFILGLQEVPVVAMADGYAQASRSLGVVNLHISCGLGNAMGMIYNAHRAGTPLLITAGQQDRRLKFQEPILASDIVRVARPYTKWAAELERIDDLPRALRRAVQTALMPPTGPVFLCIPVDLLSESAELDLTPPRGLDAHVRPPSEAIHAAAELLAGAHTPAILAGSRVVEAGAVAPLVALAELLGAAVFSESGTTHGRLSFPSDHGLYRGALPLWAPQIRERLQPFDVLFVAGADLLRLYVYYEPEPIPTGLRLVHLDADPWELGKNYAVHVGLVGNVKTGLEELLAHVRDRMSDAARTAAHARTARLEVRTRESRERLQSRAHAERAQRPMTPLALVDAIARALAAVGPAAPPTQATKRPDAASTGPGPVVVEEAVTTSNMYLERLGVFRDPSGYFGHRGWALGWGAGAAVGVKLAWPERPVVALLGEGAAMYGIQALWSAAHYRVPVTFVIANNAQYQILKTGMLAADLPAARAGRFVGMDLTEPEIDFVGLARALGVQAQRAESPDDVTQLVRSGVTGDQPLLVDAPIERVVPEQLDY